MSDIEKNSYAMVYDTMFQHVSTFQELLPQLHDDESKVLAFSSLTLNERDIQGPAKEWFPGCENFSGKARQKW